MNYDIEKALQPYHNIRMMLEGVPRDIWEMLLPAQESKLAVLESNILFHKRREKERDQVMSIQKLCGFPLRPNASLRETTIMARLEGLKKDRLRRRYNQRRHQDDEVDDE